MSLKAFVPIPVLRCQAPVAPLASAKERRSQALTPIVMKWLGWPSTGLSVVNVRSLYFEGLVCTNGGFGPLFGDSALSGIYPF